MPTANGGIEFYPTSWRFDDAAEQSDRFERPISHETWLDDGLALLITLGSLIFPFFHREISNGTVRNMENMDKMDKMEVEASTMVDTNVLLK